jgi:cobalt/nickel transport system permease protein
MMFNIPIPGGTTGHAVGGALIAIAIGPWAAALSISVALVLQALVFGDGGITAIGANCLNIAFIMPFSGWLTYRALMRFRVMQERLMWQAFAAGVSGWVGLNLAALTTAVMFGIQPILHHTAEGRPLYAPYPLSVAVPFMVLEHMVLFGLVEGLVTGMVVYGLLKSRTRWIVEASGGIR